MTLRLVDAASAQDLATYLARAKRVDDSGDVRLQAVGGVLAAWTCVVPGRGLGSSGLVLGLRTFALAEPTTSDRTVPLGAVTDRLARSGTEIPDPPMTTRPAWGALSPPRSGWEPVGTVPDARLRDVALSGIEEVAQGAPEGSGSAAVADLRSRVWGRSTDTVPPVPAGTAFGLHVLGFLRPDERSEVSVHTTGPWMRTATDRGFVIAR
ncbi:hypothetical protein [Janibacter alittae]|uniref:Uncharacterized protein n=1 Tax=Janibacter alittae TaxID=3115209 RepID=A0ABZ2MEG0_9MICO